MDNRPYAGTMLAIFALVLTSASGASQPDHGGDTSTDSVVVATDAGPPAPDKTVGPVPSGIRVKFLLDPSLTRGLHMGERWVARATFTTVRQHGRRASLDARATGIDGNGSVMYPRLEAEWLVHDSGPVEVSSTEANRVTITMQSPGEATLRVRYGDVVEDLRLRTTYDPDVDMTQLTVSRGEAN